ncbi:unnamed protein product [Urochloa humidicola]
MSIPASDPRARRGLNFSSEQRDKVRAANSSSRTPPQNTMSNFGPKSEEEEKNKERVQSEQEDAQSNFSGDPRNAATSVCERRYKGQEPMLAVRREGTQT